MTRGHGSKGRVPVDYSTHDGTAAAPSDYLATSGTLVFEDGELSHSFFIPVKNDQIREEHVETVILKLDIIGGIKGVKAGRLNSATLKIFDFMDGRSLVSDNFGLESGSTNNTMGWRIEGNGNNPAWIDTNGLYSVDQLYAADEYDASCDYAATSPCGFSCSYGGGYAGEGGVDGYGSGVLHITEGGYVASTDPIKDFPQTELTISLWIRNRLSAYKTDPLSEQVPSGGQGVVLSYEIPAAKASDPGFGSHEIVLTIGRTADSDVVVLIRGKDTNEREMSLASGIRVNDGEWHFLAVTWRSAGGEIVIYKDGVRAFTDGPYRAGTQLLSGGSIVLGGLQKLNLPCFGTMKPCHMEPHSSYLGDIQNVRVWKTARSQKQVHLGMQWPFTALRLGLVMYWRFTDNHNHSVIDYGGDGHEFLAKRTNGTTLVVDGSPSVHPNYPCGNVHHNIWHFAAPQRFLNALPGAYDGRLQFSLFAASFTGTARSNRGFVELNSGNGNRFSYDLKGFTPPSSNNWTGYSVVFREDFGWVKEPHGTPATFEEFNAALKNATKLLIRGDAWQYSRSGYGQEAVYLNNVTIFERSLV